MSRASTPTAPAPNPAAPTQAATPVAAAPARQHTHAITITPTTPPVTNTQGQRPDTLSARSAQIASKAASQFSSGSEDDQDDGDGSQAETKPEATRTTPLGQAATPAKPDDAPAPETSAREKNAARIRKALEAQTAAREAEQARRAAQTQPAQPPAPQQPQVTSQRFWADIRRHPSGVVAGLREAGWSDKEIRGFFEDATNDAIAPGTVRAQAIAEEQAAEQKRALERIGRVEQHIVTREQQAYADAEARQFHAIAMAMEGEEHLYPLSAALPDAKRYALAEWLASRKQPGTFTLESLALDLEEELASLVPKPAHTTSPASPPARPTTPAAKTKQTPAALPPDLAGEGSSRPTKPLSLAQRSAAIRRSAAKLVRDAER